MRTSDINCGNNWTRPINNKDKEEEINDLHISILKLKIKKYFFNYIYIAIYSQYNLDVLTMSVIWSGFLTPSVGSPSVKNTIIGWWFFCCTFALFTKNRDTSRAPIIWVHPSAFNSFATILADSTISLVAFLGCGRSFC